MIPTKVVGPWPTWKDFREKLTQTYKTEGKRLNPGADNDSSKLLAFGTGFFELAFTKVFKEHFIPAGKMSAKSTEIATTNVDDTNLTSSAYALTPLRAFFGFHPMDDFVFSTIPRAFLNTVKLFTMFPLAVLDGATRRLAEVIPLPTFFSFLELPDDYAAMSWPNKIESILKVRFVNFLILFPKAFLLFSKVIAYVSHFAFKGLYLLSRAGLSPKQSFISAYRTGGWPLAIVSIITTTAVMGVGFAFAAPVVLGTFIGIGVAAGVSAIAGSAAGQAVASACQLAASFLASPVGLGVNLGFTLNFGIFAGAAIGAFSGLKAGLGQGMRDVKGWWNNRGKDNSSQPVTDTTASTNSVQNSNTLAQLQEHYTQTSFSNNSNNSSLSTGGSANTNTTDPDRSDSNDYDLLGAFYAKPPQEGLTQTVPDSNFDSSLLGTGQPAHSEAKLKQSPSSIVNIHTSEFFKSPQEKKYGAQFSDSRSTNWRPHH